VVELASSKNLDKTRNVKYVWFEQVCNGYLWLIQDMLSRFPLRALATSMDVTLYQPCQEWRGLQSEWTLFIGLWFCSSVCTGVPRCCIGCSLSHCINPARVV